MNNIKQLFNQLKPWQKYMLGVIIVAVIGIYMVLKMDTSGTKKVLYNNLSTQDSADIINELIKMGIDYESQESGATVLVASDNISALRISLAAKHLPSSGTPGLESLDSSSIGDTKADKDRKYERALKGQLETDLVRGIEPISTANVQLAIAETASLFETTGINSKATVAISAKTGMHLTDVQVAGIQNFVSGAVKNMEAKDVVVVDNKGNILSENAANGTTNSTSGLSKQQQIIEQTENRIKSDIIASLSKVYGFDHVTLNVRADINFDEVLRNIEKYDPQGTLVSRDRETETAQKNNTEGSTAAGTEANGSVPGYTNTDQGATAELIQNSEKIIENFDVGKTVETIKKNPNLTNLNVVAWIDKTMGEEEVEKLRTAIAVAAGLKSFNNDGTYTNGNVEVMSVTFNQNQSVISPGEGTGEDEANEILWYQDSKFIYSAISGLGVLVLLMIFILILLGRRKKDRYVLTSVPGQNATSSSSMMTANEDEDEDLLPPKKKKQTAQEIAAQITENDPRKAAEYIRKVLRDET